MFTADKLANLSTWDASWGYLPSDVINHGGSAITQTFQTSLPAGTYCDVAHGDPGANGACSGPTYTVAANGTFVPLPSGRARKYPWG